MLYTEDIYEIDGEPYFGYMRGRYSKAELKEIDDLGASMGIEVIPCIQTLAHLTAAVRWGKFPIDFGDVLLTDDERSYEFATNLRAIVSEDAMTADWVQLPYDLLREASNRILNEVSGINRVLFDVSTKPPASIEWE